METVCYWGPARRWAFGETEIAEAARPTLGDAGPQIPTTPTPGG